MKIAVVEFESALVEPTESMDTMECGMNGRKPALPDEDPAMKNQDAFDIYTNTRMFKAMKPLLVSLRIFGLYYSRKYGMLKDCPRKSSCKIFGESYKKKLGQRFPTPSMLYSMILLVLYLVNYFRIFTLFAEQDLVIGIDLFNKCVTVTWLTLGTINFIMFFRAAFHYEGIPKFFIEWDKMLQSSMAINHMEKVVKRATRVTVIGMWILMVTGLTIILYTIIAMPAFIDTIFAPYTFDNPDAWIIQIIVCILQPLMNALWAFGIGFDFIFCYVLYKMFEHWTNDFRKTCAKGITTSAFELLQLQHQKICRLVGHVDEFLSLHKVNSFICSFAVLMFTMYNWIYFPPELRTTTTTGMFMVWVLAASVSLVMNCISGIMVNTMAHAVYDDILDLQGKVALPQFFLSRLSGESIGLTAAGLFVFDKPLILNTFGMLLSYFIVMLQFSPESSASALDAACNCTSV